MCTIVNHKALHLHIGSIVENITIEEMSEAAQEPEGEQQFQEENNAAQDTNLNLTNSAIDQGKPQCISTIIIGSLLHSYLCVIYLYLCIRFCRN